MKGFLCEGKMEKGKGRGGPGKNGDRRCQKASIDYAS